LETALLDYIGCSGIPNGMNLQHLCRMTTHKQKQASVDCADASQQIHRPIDPRLRSIAAALGRYAARLHFEQTHGEDGGTPVAKN